ncbi:hypothetical protein [Streptomyces sp. NPDC060022]|uniref:hypothetical protein n=1 Tax=Streptomyces sp. NPDC060022 TaxID=3347039 RepID=UPI0036C50CB6
MDASAVLWILAWSGVLSIAIFVSTGILGQLLPLVEAWRKLLNALRDGNEKDVPSSDGSASSDASTESPTTKPTQARAGGSEVGAERGDEVDSAASAPPSHQ